MALPLAACGGASEAEGDVSEGMGNATPIPAVKEQENDLPGEVVALPNDVTGAVVVADNVLLRAGGEVLSGTVDKPNKSSSKVDSSCGELAPAHDVAVLPCGDGIHVIAADSTDTAVIGRGTAYSSAVGLKDGRILGHRADSDRIDVYGANGELSEDFAASRHGSQLIEVPKAKAGEGANDDKVMLLEINRPETSIHEIVLSDSRSGNGLRAGIGVGPAVAADDGTVAAVDTKGNQLLIYTATDVVRLHQASPVPDGPWGVAIDEERDLVWVSSTVDGVLTAWDISSGTAVKVAKIPTVADPQGLVALSDGSIVAYSASGAGAHVLDKAAIDDEIDKQKSDADADAKLKELRKPEHRLPTGEKN